MPERAPHLPLAGRLGAGTALTLNPHDTPRSQLAAPRRAPRLPDRRRGWAPAHQCTTPSGAVLLQLVSALRCLFDTAGPGDAARIAAADYAARLKGLTDQP
ncbi:hypothetical protein ACWGAN_17910 [Streptomyces sp. NPDC054945]